MDANACSRVGNIDSLRLLFPALALITFAATTHAQDTEGFVLGRAELTPAQILAADLNADGLVDASDVLLQSRLSGRPTIAFSSATTTALEGSSRLEIRVGFDRPYQGAIEWEISGTALPGQDFIAASTSMAVDGLGADIVIDLVDDETLEPEVATIELRLRSGAGHDLGAPFLHTVYLEDNDRLWDVATTTGYLQNQYLLEVIRFGSDVTGRFVSTGVGTLPTGSFPMEYVLSTGERFEARSLPIPLAASGSLLVRRAAERVLEIRAVVGEQADQVTPELIRGRLTDRLRAADRADAFIDRVVTGDVVLTRRPLRTPPLIPVLTDATPK